MSSLLKHIRSLIEKQGPISLARYMELALQHPEWGYYRKNDPLGAGGDFVTAPEISQMFGELVGLWCAEGWKALGKPEAFTLLELGPGRGTLMQDALRATAKIHGFHSAMHLALLETNFTLRDVQEKKLSEHHPRYVEDLEQIPAVPLFVIANEFFDALPVRQFEHTADGWRERLVMADEEELEFVLSPPDPALLMLIPQEIREAPIGMVHESCLPALSITRHLARHIAQYGGATLLIDYGYTAPPGKPTMQATSSHRHADVLERPGEVDLTAHVDFPALRHIAQGQDVTVLGPVGQGEFLQMLGIDVRAMQLKLNATPEQSGEIDAAVRRLTDASEMGTLFKVMAVVSKQLEGMAGF